MTALGSSNSVSAYGLDTGHFVYRVVDADGTNPSSVYLSIEDAREARSNRAALWPSDGPQTIQRRWVSDWNAPLGIQ